MDGLTISNATSSMTGSGVNSISTDKLLSNSDKSVENGAQNFADTLKSAVNDVNNLQKTSNVEMQKLATGQTSNIHGVMIAADKAEIALKLLVQVRNKMIAAYQDIMRMQV